jgi:hypothetical protein
VERPNRKLWRGPIPGCPVQEPHRWRECRGCQNAYMRQQRARGKWPFIYDFKAKARAKVKYALKTGRLEKEPCEVCRNLDVQAHHQDYSKPLHVRWLCRVHHRALHSAAKSA